VSDLVRNIIRFVLFILVQVYVLDKIPHLHRSIVPYIYYLFILWLPYATPRLALLVIAFFTGLSLDYYKMTPGLHAAVCTLIAYVRPFIITILSPKDTTEFSHREPSARGMGWSPYLVYALILTLMHHIYLCLLEWLQFGSFLSFIIKVAATSAISMLLIITVELLFPRKMKYRTNTI
jgi:cell shape-determining protein MreD